MYAGPASQAVSALVDSQEPVPFHPSEAPSVLRDDPYGRPSERMGRPLPSQVSAGDVVSEIPVVSYKHPRSDGSVLDIGEDQPRVGLSCSSHVGQRHNCSLSQQERLQVSSDQPCDSGHSFPGQ